MTENKRKNIPLTVLDDYTKILTSKQVGKLYESKIGKKHINRLLLEEDKVGDVYSVFIPTKVYEYQGFTPYSLINTLQYGDKEKGDKKIEDVSFKTKDTAGILIVCKYPPAFKEILSRIANANLGKEIAQYVKPSKFQACLYPEGCKADI